MKYCYLQEGIHAYFDPRLLQCNAVHPVPDLGNPLRNHCNCGISILGYSKFEVFECTIPPHKGSVRGES